MKDTDTAALAATGSKRTPEVPEYTAIPRRNLALREVAQILGIAHRTIHNALSQPERYQRLVADLPPLQKIGGRWYCYGPTLEAHIARKERGL